MTEYLVSLCRSSLVLLAYAAKADILQPSGVFSEAASLGKPLVVPAGTWMADEIAAGRAVGTIFEESTAESVAASVVEALQRLDTLTAAAEQIAPAMREENSCQRVLERMLELDRQSPDMEPRYRLGEDIDFNDAYDSCLFMGAGWSHTEDCGAWTSGTRHN
jgi:glycosyltransferase involved in cell wall biosynthesis